MGPAPWVRRGGGLAAVVVWMACLLPTSAAGPLEPEQSGALLRLAAQAEARRDWVRATELYEQVLLRARQPHAVRDRYLACLRRAQMIRRHGDASYLQQAKELSLSQALDLYGELLRKLASSYLDPHRTELIHLTRQGLEELRLALEEEDFCRQHLTKTPRDTVRDFRERLMTAGDNRPVRTVKDAQALAEEVALLGQKTVQLNPALAVLEIACGACANLDEYTHYLSPGQFAEFQAALKGEQVGVGLELVRSGDQLLIHRVVPGGPADLAGLRPNDRLLRIGKQSARFLTAEAASSLLQGEADTVVELEILPVVESVSRMVRLTRQALVVPSVSRPRFLGDRMLGIGYLQVTAFQETTPRELDEALVELQMAGLRALVLDLRDNPGGVLEAAVGVVERFLPSGVVGSTQGQLRSANRTYHANGLNALNVPLVVLINNATASAAELVAGALREHHRATLVGQTTFGKWTIQRCWRLSTAPAGLRVSVARFFSPSGRDYDGLGVTPHISVEGPDLDWSMDPEQDAQVRAALETARQLTLGR